MRPVLVLLNGLPGSGKSTLARAWCERHADGLPLALDVDVLRAMLGGWRTRPIDAGLAARTMALAAARTRLEADHDVVVPQFLRRPDFVDALAGLARETGAAFLHCSIDVDPAVAAERLHGRGGSAHEGPLEQPLEALSAELAAFLDTRAEVVRLAPSGDGVADLDRLVGAARAGTGGPSGVRRPAG